MQYLLTFLEGIISFISPCMLPMLPVYISYFGGKTEKKQTVLVKVLFFVLGFSLVFCALGVFAGTIGTFLKRFQALLDIICGIIIIFFGLSYLEVFNLPFFKGMKNAKAVNGNFGAFIFGIIYSVSLTPCVGAFLGSAIIQATSSGSTLTGFLLLLFYSLGLGIPFVFSAVLLDKLSGAFDIIKRNYKRINLICGIFLIFVGILMCCGILNKLLAVFAFGGMQYE